MPPQVLRQPLVLLDAAKACQTAPPDLSRHPVHFLALSFYKVFGYPTGLGALVVRKDTSRHLHPPFLGGGTVSYALPGTWPSPTPARRYPAAFEPGTPHFLGLRALPAGFAAWQTHARDRHGAERAAALAAALAQELRGLRHGNGRRMCTVLGRHCEGARGGLSHAPPRTPTPHDRAAAAVTCNDRPWALGIGEGVGAGDSAHGPVVAFVVWDGGGAAISSHSVRDMLAAARVVVRAGCCCNPGACAAALGLADGDVLRNIRDGWTCGGDVGVVAGRHTGVVRASLGIMTAADDTRALVAALREGVGELDGGGGGRRCVCAGDARAASGSIVRPEAHRSGSCLAGCACGTAEECGAAEDGCRSGGGGDGLARGDAGVASAAKCREHSMHSGNVDLRHGGRPDSAVGVVGGGGARGGERRGPQGGSPRVVAVWLYPVKSLGGQEVQRWPVTAGGLLLDRAWAVTDRSGRVLSCACYPRLLLFSAAVDLGERVLRLAWRGGARGSLSGPDGGAHVHAPDVGREAQGWEVIEIAWPACMQGCAGEGAAGAAQGCCGEYAVAGWWVGRGGGCRNDSVDVNAWVSQRLGMEAFVMHRCRAAAQCTRQRRPEDTAGCGAHGMLCKRTNASLQGSPGRHACNAGDAGTLPVPPSIAGIPVVGQIAVGMACAFKPHRDAAVAEMLTHVAHAHGEAEPGAVGGACRTLAGGGAASFANKGDLLLASLAGVRRAAALLPAVRPAAADARPDSDQRSPTLATAGSDSGRCSPTRGARTTVASTACRTGPDATAGAGREAGLESGGGRVHGGAGWRAGASGGDEGAGAGERGGEARGCGCSDRSRAVGGLQEKSVMQRFRVNVVIDGVGVGTEGSWTELRVRPAASSVGSGGGCGEGEGARPGGERVGGDVVLAVVGKAERCGAINVDVETGIKHQRHGGLLGALRRASGGGAAVTWGVYASVQAGPGDVHAA